MEDFITSNSMTGGFWMQGLSPVDKYLYWRKLQLETKAKTKEHIVPPSVKSIIMAQILQKMKNAKKCKKMRYINMRIYIKLRKRLPLKFVNK